MHTSMRKRSVQTLLLAAAATAVIGGTAYAATESGPSTKERCEQGEFCTWQRAYYKGKIHKVDLRTANPGECIPLTPETYGRAFANRTSRDITVYQGEDCSTEGDFTTYPGRGTWVPDAPFVVRGFQIWE